ncbi:glycosyltransferase family 1 protein [Candidatus Microgenomates bacterium]|jgi:glycosyltransferase involved in cell wall biosynthesis|nr:MAG: glycosyltransferase family 1 protein [Candidatus Microgenomates bacterium]
MKILLGITYYLPNVSGVTIYARRLAEELVKKGHEVTIIASRHDKSLPLKETINGVRVRRVPVFLKIGKGVIMPTLPFLVLREALFSDVINCHLPQFESFVFAVTGKILGKKIILTHHTDLSGWKGFLNRISEASVWLGQMVAGALADKIVPYTKDYADHSWFLRLFPKKLFYILPPIVTGKVKKELKEKWRKEAKNPEVIIGFAGRIARQKGIPYLLNAVPLLRKEFPSFKIIFAGPHKGVIGEKYFEEIEKLVTKYKKNLCFLGNIKEDDMASFYSLCDVLVLPSDDRLESFGLVQPEAMLKGCPVLVSDLPGVRVPVKLTGMGLTFKPKDTKDLIQKTTFILRNKAKFQINQKRLREIFSLKKTIKEYEKVFKN